MTPLDDLFQALDHDGDGELARADLHAAARRMGWHWRQAPLFAVLDRLTLGGHLRRETFVACMEEASRDPLGLFGDVLRRVPYPAEPPATRPIIRPAPNRDPGTRIEASEASGRYGALLRQLSPLEVPADGAALLIIDPQRSFTEGVWMRSVGSRSRLARSSRTPGEAPRTRARSCFARASRTPGEAPRTRARWEVRPLRRAFDSAARLLRARPDLERVFTRCPFPPESYGWDGSLDGVVDDSQPYFVKPGNSVLWPPTNGFVEWADALAERGKGTLVIGGCTLNSCVRVSATEILEHLGGKLAVVVDLSLSGARAENHAASAQFGGRSSVEAAVDEMRRRGVSVTPEVLWV